MKREDMKIALTGWRPASGYRARSGKWYWRVVIGHRQFEELKDKRGNLRLFKSFEAAWAVSDKLNKAMAGLPEARH